LSITITVEKIAALLQVQQRTLVTAESCTGGWIAKLLTDAAGSSAWFECGFIVYSNTAKRQLLQVPDAMLTRYGAVSEQTVIAMVRGALHLSQARVALAVSGIAGPGGGSPEKPVGTVGLAWGLADGACHSRHHWFAGARQSVREQAAHAALEGLLDVLDNS
jgi:nicotinamide-nucleotide amidase